MVETENFENHGKVHMMSSEDGRLYNHVVDTMAEILMPLAPRCTAIAGRSNLSMGRL